MHNSLILSRFFTFLRERDLLTPYMRALVGSATDYPRYLEVFFFLCDPKYWISSAFIWVKDTSINWCSVNELWLARLNALKNNEFLK